MIFSKGTTMKAHILVCSFLLWFALCNVMSAESQSEIYNGRPVWSPDGQLMVFSSNYEGNLDLLLMSKDGKDGTNLTIDFDPSVNFNMYSWSPDGKSIALATMEEKSSIWLLDIEELTSVNLTAGISLSAGGQPSWSPDGKYLSFVILNQDSTSSVWVTDLDTATSVQLDVEGQYVVTPKWVNNMLFFLVYSQSDSYIQYVDTESDIVRTLEVSNVIEFETAPNEEYVAYSATHDDFLLRNDLVIYSLEDDSEILRISDENLSLIEGISWSSDSSKVSFAVLCGNQVTSGIWSLEIEDAELTELISCDFGDSKYPSWSPSDDVIAFQSRIDQETHIWIFDTNTGELENLTLLLD